MAILALDTSTEMCGVALGVLNDQDFEMVYERNDLLQRTHSRMLLPMVRTAMSQAGIASRQIDAVAVTAGPGSFTGIRIAMATAKGLALAWRVPVIPVGTLDVIAMNVRSRTLICPVLDARRGAIYAGLFRTTETNTVNTVARVMAHTPVRLVAMLEGHAAGGEAVTLIGDATPIVLEAAKGLSLASRFEVYNDDWYPRSGNVARLAAIEYRRGNVDQAGDVVPSYFRRSEAEEKWDAR